MISRRRACAVPRARLIVELRRFGDFPYLFALALSIRKSAYRNSTRGRIYSRLSCYIYVSLRVYMCVCVRARSFSHCDRMGKEKFLPRTTRVCGRLAVYNGCARRYSDLRCRILRKRMIDMPLFTSTFRRPHLCYHMTGVMTCATLALGDAIETLSPVLPPLFPPPPPIATM